MDGKRRRKLMNRKRKKIGKKSLISPSWSSRPSNSAGHWKGMARNWWNVVPRRLSYASGSCPVALPIAKKKMRSAWGGGWATPRKNASRMRVTSRAYESLWYRPFYVIHGFRRYLVGWGVGVGRGRRDKTEKYSKCVYAWDFDRLWFSVSPLELFNTRHLKKQQEP